MTQENNSQSESVSTSRPILSYHLAKLRIDGAIVSGAVLSVAATLGAELQDSQFLDLGHERGDDFGNDPHDAVLAARRRGGNGCGRKVRLWREA